MGSRESVKEYLKDSKTVSLKYAQIPAKTAVAVFVYNRPVHAKRLFSSIVADEESKKFPYYVFSDGPRVADSLDSEQVSKVRQVCGQYSGQLSISLFCSQANRGLAESIVTGVTHVLRDHEMVIVLEDDLVLKRGFFEYMTSMLAYYASNELVYQISGYMVPTTKRLPVVGLFRVPGSWGWATWRRAWAHYNDDVNELVSSLEASSIYEFNVEGTFDHYQLLLENQRGVRSTWAIRWYASMFLRGGLALYPNRSFVENEGFDGSGTNCGKETLIRNWRWRPSRARWMGNMPDVELESRAFLDAYKDFYKRLVRHWTVPTLRDRVRAKFREIG